MTQDVWREAVGFHPQKTVVVESSGGGLFGEAGLLIIRECDEKLGLTKQFAARIQDLRDDPSHSILSMVRQRAHGIIAGYEDQNDHDTLRHDPIFQLICDRLPEDSDDARLASQPTLSRFEDMVDIPALFRLRELLVTQFLDQFTSPPSRLTFDVDGFDDPAHGRQRSTLCHGYYGQNQYFPLVITNAETGLVVMVALRHGTAHAALGADDDRAYLVTRSRQRWPAVDLEVRADSGFGVPQMDEVCERLGIWHTFGFGMNSRLAALSDDPLDEAIARYEQTHQKQRLFTALRYQASSWTCARGVVIKAEAHAAGGNRRAVVSDRPGALIAPEGLHDDDIQRGESENRNKELEIDPCGGRLSDHRFLANLPRLDLHARALNLIIRMRRMLITGHDGDPQSLRELRSGQPATWRTRIIQVADEVIVSRRRALARLSSARPGLPIWRAVL